MSDPSNAPLAKHLASTDKKTRDKAVKALVKFLSESSYDALSEAEMAKLWKGIFYCYWMSDKPLVQQALSSELAEIVLSINTTKAALAFLKGFWEAIVREWNGIDRLRMDKYYMLVRKYVRASFTLLLRTNWKAEYCEEYNKILTSRDGPIHPDNPKLPNSLTYHVIDLYLEEIQRSLQESSPCHPAPLHTLLDPFIILASKTSNNITYDRLQSSLFDPLIQALNAPTESEDVNPPPAKRLRTLAPDLTFLCQHACLDSADEPIDPMPPRELRKTLLRNIFERASHEDSRVSNRKKMYQIWRNAMEEEEGKKELDAN
ncbi:Nop52-domain-containing protein [Sistotremastrum niveocremeum HHB9708]|uniref:Nop52-domain-containing protein n=1 Tax=Sistotremastrum niveocremeum HHB9708 TaxID=1314777 RepID=A0A164UEP1_9AGAM|nr:Nop52-domain-containing protein [Sistotremastrum niveocremeum HHB9708]